MQSEASAHEMPSRAFALLGTVSVVQEVPPSVEATTNAAFPVPAIPAAQQSDVFGHEMLARP
jgi:hypothetical protein